jgi:hypothetical protein
MRPQPSIRVTAQPSPGFNRPCSSRSDDSALPPRGRHRAAAQRLYGWGTPLCLVCALGPVDLHSLRLVRAAATRTGRYLGEPTHYQCQDGLENVVIGDGWQFLP